MSLAKLIPINNIKYLIKISDITIDDAIFKLHYRYTFTFLLVGSLLLTGDKFFGKPIHCLTAAEKKPDVPQKIIENFCWIEGTFTLPKGLMKVIGSEIAAPGIEQYKEIVEEAKTIKDEVIEHSYYQWVAAVLFLQALCFYVPHFVWKYWEKNTLSQIIDDLNKIQLKFNNVRQSKVDKLVEHLANSQGTHNSYSFRYFLCECMNLVNVIIQMIFINSFLGGEFTSYGFDVFKFLDQDPSVRVDPMAKVFPKLTKCTFRHYGPSGDLQTSDHLCLLPLNNLNEKMFTIFWFWFYIVLVFSALAIIYRILVIGFPSTRVFLMGSISVWRARKDMSQINEFMSYSDWFILHQLNRNLDKMLFKEFLGKYVDAVESRERYDAETKYPALSTDEESDREVESPV